MPAIAGITIKESPIAPCQGTLEIAPVFAFQAIARKFDSLGSKLPRQVLSNEIRMKFEKNSRSALFIIQVSLSNVQTNPINLSLSARLTGTFTVSFMELLYQKKKKMSKFMFFYIFTKFCFPNNRKTKVAQNEVL